MKIDKNLIKKLRISRGWTQEHLADVCDCTSRTISRVEKNGVCTMETAQALAVNFGVDVAHLIGEEKIEQLQQNTGTDDIYLIGIHSGKKIVAAFIETLGFKIDYEIPRSANDAEFISEVIQEIKDWGEIWSDLDVGEQILTSYKLNELINEIEERGLILFGLKTKEKLNILSQDIDGFVCNFYICYKDNPKIIILDEFDESGN